ncbi:hypothetical protein [Actinoalloteichus caeruleus]|uniref:hypothetical protein n=1 Tax=Actinoalloteichus cyanogriseus TaxID=2893586 RepID=UPI0004A9E080|nr:hypothetical protein [Actinoalloteichus caeruleus]
MRFWATNRALPVVTGMWLVTLVLVAPFGSTLVPTPNVLGGIALALPAAVLIPLLCSGSVAYLLSRAPRDWEANAVRPVRVYDSAFLVALGGLYGVLCLALHVTDLQPTAVIAARNALGFTGLALLVSRFSTAVSAATVPTLYAVAAMVLGDRGRSWWAWPVSDVFSVRALGLAVLLFVLGVVAHAWLPGWLRRRQVAR